MQETDFIRHVLPLRDKLYRLALSIVPDPAEAEDITQDTMLKVYQKLPTIRQPQAIEAYCLTTTRRLATDRLRTLQRHHPIDTHTQPIADPDTPHDQLARQEQTHHIRQLILRLPPRQQLILHLRDIEGHTYREIAQILRLTEAQVKIELYRARQKLRKALSLP